MPGPVLSQEKIDQIRELRKQGLGTERIAELTGTSNGSASKYSRDISHTPPVIANKKVGEFDWREWADWAKQGQKLKSKASWSQEKAEFTLGDGASPIILATFSDQQIGDWGTNYSLFATITEEIRDTHNLYMAMLGDETQHAIKMRSVLEVASGSLIPPEQQEMFMEAWLKEIGHKIAFGCWSNHSVERSEKQSGSSVIKNLISRHAVYYNGIGHADIKVGKEIYTVAASHVFRGRSQFTANHGPRRYARHEGQDREIILQADLHTPELSVYYEGGKKRVAITCGSIQDNSGYAKRYFSLHTVPAYPCIVLRHDRHELVPFWSIKDALDYVRGDAAL